MTNQPLTATLMLEVWDSETAQDLPHLVMTMTLPHYTILN